jgi:hypothetical protein
MKRIVTFTHGRNCYSNHGCRCQICTAGNREKNREWRRRRTHAVQVKKQ